MAAVVVVVVVVRLMTMIMMKILLLLLFQQPLHHCLPFDCCFERLVHSLSPNFFARPIVRSMYDIFKLTH